MKIMLAVTFGIALGMMSLSAHPLAASTISTPLAHLSGPVATSGLGAGLTDTVGPELTSASRTDVAVAKPSKAREEIPDFRNDPGPLVIQKAGLAGFPIFPCRDTSKMLAQGLTQGPIPAVRVTVDASSASWCSEQSDSRLGAAEDVAAAVEPMSLAAELVDGSITIEEQPKLTPRHVGGCGRLSEL